MNKRSFHIVILIVCIVTIAVGFCFTLDDFGLYFLGWKWPLYCLLSKIFGFKCAFCGMTQSFTAMSDGRLSQAFCYHPVGPAFFIFIVFQLPYRILMIAGKSGRIQKTASRINAGFTALILAAILMNWLIYTL